MEGCGIKGTYYVSLGLMGKTTPTGKMFLQQDLEMVLEKGHELGCHTYDHCPAHTTGPAAFERSMLENRRVLGKAAAGTRMVTLSYPVGIPRARTKKRCERHVDACRAGGQRINSGVVDLNYLQAFFLEQCGENLEVIKAVVEEAVSRSGWLIFATHDVTESPTRYGCRPSFFEAVLDCAVASGARIVSVKEGLERSGVEISMQVESEAARS